MAVTNPSLRGTLRRATVCWLLFLFVLCFTQCNGAPIAILNIDTSGFSNGNESILLRPQLNGVPGTEQRLDISQNRITIQLPDSASGTLQVDVFALDKGGCKISSASVSVDVPGGLSRSVELPVTLNRMNPFACTLTVTVSAGSLGGSVVSIPPGINCSASATCTADFPQDMSVQLITNPNSARAYAAFDGACQGPAANCTFALSSSQQVSVSFLPIDCTADGWCTQSQPTQTNTLRAVSVLGSQRAFAVGDGGVMLECNGALCTKYASNTTVNLRSVFAVNASNIYAVGDSGTVLRCDTSSRSCQPLLSGAANTPVFRGVWASDVNNVYAVGAASTIIRCSMGSNSCTPLTLSPGSSTTFNAIWGAGTSAYAVGTGGIIYRCSAGMGTMCTQMTSSTSGDLNAVFGIGNTVYAAGPSNALLGCTNGNTACSGPNPNVTGTMYNGVWNTDSSNVYSVGTGGQVVRCDFASMSCLPATSAVTQTLNAIWGTDISSIYAVGSGGKMQQCKTSVSTTTCTVKDSGTTQDLRAIFGFDETHIWAVGTGGVVVYHSM